MSDLIISDLFNFNRDDYGSGVRIGNGNFGNVYKIQHKDTNVPYALKVIIECDENDQSYYVGEVVSMSMLAKHPAIVSIISASFKPLSFLMPFYPNGSVEDLIIKEIGFGRMVDGTIKSKILYGISSAIMYMHSNQVAHRDVKTDNVLLDEHFEPILSDFGFAKCVSRTMYGTKLGTDLYMAPELIDPNVEIRNLFALDVYAFGIFLLRLCGTEFMFNGVTIDDSVNVSAKVLEGVRFTIPDTVPDQIKNLITMCWNQDPQKRPNFELICSKIKNQNICFPNTNQDEFNSYKNKIDAVDVDETAPTQPVIPTQKMDFTCF